mmetsp:Transcript_81275/g.161293  ORF Transcript_81275/g.161293 Transcript_81275/m.161293 type:complete len:331 (-) Transcript_81275:53-1045(-)
MYPAAPYAGGPYGGSPQVPSQAYGSFSGQPDPSAKFPPRGPRRRINAVPIFLSLFGPWLLFAVVYGAMTFSLHYEKPALVFIIVNLSFIVVIGVALAALSRLRKQAKKHPLYEASWLTFMFVTMLVGWTVAVVAGDMNYYQNMKLFYDLMNLNSYPEVDPAVTRGQMVMDAGRINFVADTHLDLKRSIGFKHNDVYCVAPVSKANKANSTKGSLQTLSNYDFWAVGVNCCSGNEPDFHCGQYKSPSAHGGLRLMSDDERAFFRLAVQQAEAAYNIKATHPLFFHWMQDPQQEVNSYHQRGITNYLMGVFIFFSIQLFLVAAASLAFARLK